MESILDILAWWRQEMIMRLNGARVLFKEGELWWCRVGVNIGVEIYGKGSGFVRPVLIFKKFSEESFLAIPLTTQKKRGSWYVPILFSGEERIAILSQARTLDARRLVRKIGVLGGGSLRRVHGAFTSFYTS